MRYALVFLSLGIFAFAFSHANAANTISWTFYGPGAGGQMQGSMSAASNNLEGNNTIRTLDDVRTGKSKYVTLASATVMRGKFFCIGTVTYTSPPSNGGDGKTHTLENVVGYVHDTGCAFNGTCSCSWLPQYCNKQPRTDKMDIAVGNFTGYDGSFAMNFITKNPNKAPAQWTQISGLPAAGSQPSASNPCGGQVKEDGSGSPAYIPPANSAPTNPLTKVLQGAVQGYTQPQQQYPIQNATYQPGSAQTGGTLSNTAGTTVISPAPTYTATPIVSPAPLVPDALYPQPYAQPQRPTSTTDILSSLFQTAPATSGIRVLQTAAQSITGLFQGQPSPQTGNGRPVTVEPLIVQGEDNVSLMSVSQYDQAAQAVSQSEVPGQLPRVQEIAPQPQSQTTTFGSNAGEGTSSQTQPAASPVFFQTMQLILNALQKIVSSLSQFFAKR